VIGKHLNNYEVVSLLGEGGMGTVYLALHPIMGRKAAIKVLKPELARDESLVTRFFNEARAANAIRHPNIIDIIDVGMLPDENVPYMLMEFLEGESLSSRLDRIRPLPVENAVEIALQTASALAAAHSKGIVHRDLKPDNLFLVPDETVASGERVKVLDFGIAKLRDDMRGSSMKTRTGAIMGTAAYMSPEQCQGLIERVDQRTDIYALGIILYEMLCGAPPFVSEGFGDIIIMHVMRPPEPPQSKNPAIPDSVAAAMLCALSKEPADRFQSMAEFQAALRSSTGMYAAPVFGAPPSTVRTAVLEGEQAAAARPFDRTMATPAPVAVGRAPSRPPYGMGTTPPPMSGGRAPSRPPRALGMTPPPAGAGRSPSWPPHVSTMLDPSASVAPPGTTKQSTTFRNASGELAATDVNLRGKRNTVVAIGAVVALAAAGLVITLIVTRPAPKPIPVETTAPVAAPEPTPVPSPLPPPQAEPIHEPESPPPANTLEVERPLANERKPIKKPSGGKIRHPEHATDPAPQVAPEASGKKPDTERW
jgi:serine/threonine protein kinase